MSNQPISIMKPYEANPHCPKCEFDDIKWGYVTEYLNIEEEHLFMLCKTCGHSWRMRCADWKDPDDIPF